ncbi:MAG: hypothetical protein QM809_04505 [Gordonia sp. (in: high G+C Gram-positive bacteria)]|uniref:hypothetical protein n=1 Tax=Gordonia sp. (in: high G+C Gram-positive bacteria) TaxID=84139 RepID=UPI0039E28455
MTSSPNPFGPAPGGPGGNPGNPFAPSGGSPAGGPPPSPGGFPSGPGGFPNGPGGFPGGPTSTSGFPGTPASPPAAPLESVGPPTPILIAAGVCAVLGIIVGAVFFAGPLSLLGWFLAGPVAIGVLALFTSRDTANRAAPLYLRPGWVGAAYVGVLVLVAVGVILGAVAFALWMGHR